MELQVLVSKKGTKVVTAANLHLALQLNNDHYLANTKRWLSDIYEFSDGIRRPEKLKDYAPRKLKDQPIMEDYYLSVELAKLIALKSKSKVKKKYAKWLFAMEDKMENGELLTKEQVLSAMELAKAMRLMSNQLSSERNHLKKYKQKNEGEANNWWKYRESILGYSVDELRNRFQRLGEKPQGKSQRQMLFELDKYETIRTGVIDFLMSVGKSDQYACKMGDLAKAFAQEMQLEIFDDRKGETIFSATVNKNLLEGISQEGARLTAQAS